MDKVGMSQKQADFMATRLKRLNILQGSVRSGKTFISLPKFAMEVFNSPPHYEFIMTGKTINSLERNCLNLLKRIVGSKNFKYSLTMKKGILFGRTVYLEGANDEKAFTKIQGMTLGGAYCDETVSYPQSFFSMLLSRLSERGAFLLGTCNPDNPNHYIKKQYLDNKDLDLSNWHFVLEDNIFLDPKYIENIKKEYTGVYYQRLILGLWVMAEGVIFKQFADDNTKFLFDELPEPINLLSFGVDWGGNKSKTTFVACGFAGDYQRVYILKDKKLEGAKGTIDPEKVYEEFYHFYMETIGEYKKVSADYVFCDSAEQLLINGLARYLDNKGLGIRVRDCDKSTINARIMFKNSMLNTGKYKIKSTCKNVINSTMQQVWNSKTTTDERLDDGTVDIDTADAEEYSWTRYLPKIQRSMT